MIKFLLCMEKLPQMSCSMTKQIKSPVCSTKTQISLGIRPVWSVFVFCSNGSQGPKVSLYGHSKDWSKGMDAQADLSLHWASRWMHKSFCWFCHATAHIESQLWSLLFYWTWWFNPFGITPVQNIFPIGHNANDHTLILSQLSANITWPKRLPCLESSPTPVPKDTTTKTGWLSRFSAVQFCWNPGCGSYPPEIFGQILRRGWLN